MRRLSRRHALATLCAAVGGTLTSSIAAAAEPYVLRLGEPQPANSVLGQVGIRFAQAVARRTNGQVKIEVYPNGQLASQQQTIDGLGTGLIDFAIQGSSILEQILPQYQVLALPFLFRDLGAGHRALDGPIGQDLFAALEPKGMIGLGGTGSFREFWTISKAISVPEDMKGLRFRIPGGQVTVATYQALGALPVTIDQAEVFTAAKQRTIDGIDTNIDGFTTEKYFTAVKHMATSNHIFSVNMMLASKRKLSTLPAPLQKIIVDEGRATVPFWRSLIVRQTATDIDILKGNGVAITEIQYPAFRKSMDPVYALMQSKIGSDLVERVGRAAR